MAAEDHTETLATGADSSGAMTSTRSALVALPGWVGDWLDARTSAATADVPVIVTTLGNRCMVRTELGESASTIEWHSRTEVRAADLAAIVRRWARDRGLAARSEAGRGADARVVITPLAATQS